MKKYYYIFKTNLIEQLGYFADILIGFISFIIMMVIFLYLWQYIYQDPDTLIKGYTMTQMIWYVIITEMTWYGTRNKTLTAEISDDIKSGKIAYNINKPYNYVFYIMAKYISEIVLRFFIYVGLAIITGIILIGPLTTFQPLALPFIIITFIFGIIINAIIRITISLASFWIEENKPFHWMYDKLILVVGTIFPIEMFPTYLQPIIKLTPIFVVMYGPAKLVVDFSYGVFFQVITAQIIYIVISIILMTYLYNKGVKKLNVNGG